MDFRILGWITLALAVIASSPYWLRTLNSWTVKTKDKRFMNALKFLRKLHKPLGIVLALLAIWHGYEALLRYQFRLHTGLIAYAGFVITALLGIWHWRKKNKQIFKVHKTMALISVLLVVIHLLWPGAIWQLLGI